MKLAFIFSFAIAFGFFAEASSSESDKNLKLRLNGYVQSMVNGKKTRLVKVKDYYSAIYITKKASVISIEKKSEGVFRAELQFEVVRKIQQSAEVSPFTISDLKEEKILKRSITFRVTPKTLKILEPLESPFVSAGAEGRYLLTLTGTP